MGQLIIPNEIKINGPWILEESAIEELGNIIEVIDAKLEVAYDLLIERKASEIFDESRGQTCTDTLEGIKKSIAQDYDRRGKRKCRILLLSATGKRIVDNSIVSLLKDRNINDFSPNGLFVEITKGPIEFQLELTTKFDGDFETRLRAADDNIAADINYELYKWIGKNKPNLALQKWSSWIPLAFFPILILLVSISGTFFLKTDKENYRDELRNQAAQILTDGISKEEVQSAIEIILKSETGFTPNNYKGQREKNQTLLNIWIVSLLIMTILFIKPRTTIGLGKNRWKASFYRKWIYIVSVFIPMSILLPILRNKLF